MLHSKIVPIFTFPITFAAPLHTLDVLPELDSILYNIRCSFIHGF